MSRDSLPRRPYEVFKNCGTDETIFSLWLELQRDEYVAKFKPELCDGKMVAEEVVKFFGWLDRKFPPKISA